MHSVTTWLSGWIASPGALLLLDAAVKGTFLLIVAIVATTLMRRSSAALRHRLWCLTFCGLILLPVLSWSLPEWRIAVLPAPEPAAVVDSPVTPAAKVERRASDAADASSRRSPTFSEKPGFSSANRPLAGSAQWDQHERGALISDASSPIPPTPDGSPTDAAAETKSPAAFPVAEVARLWPNSGEFGYGSASVNPIVLWLIGFAVAVLPLGLGIVQNHRLRRRGQRLTEPAWTRLRDELRGRLGLTRQVGLLETALPLVPMTCGVLRPVVLFPEQARRWTDRLRRLVLLHELAHVKRFDVAFQMLARLACALYWFHPLAWYALRRLRIERELACDDCVLNAGERSSDYAEELLTIARTFRPVNPGAAVAMAHTSRLERRIRSLLDGARSHVPLSARAARLLLAATILIVPALAVVRPGTKPALSDEPAENRITEAESNVGSNEAQGALSGVDDAREGIPKNNTGAPAARDSDTSDVELRYQGTVVDPQGMPVAGAKLYFVYWIHGVLPDYSVKPLAVTDKQGRFRFTRKKSDFARSGDPQAWRYAAIVATADGFGFAHGMSSAFETTDYVMENLTPEMLRYMKERPTNPDRVLRLVKDDVPITGRVVTIEGNPVAGARIRVDRLWWNPNANLDAWEKATKDEKADFYSLRRQTSMSMNGPQLRSVIGEVTTDARGRFQLHGIGRERIVQLLIRGPGIESMIVKARTRQSDKVVVPHQWPRGELRPPDEIYFGASFTHVAGPSKPVVGRVTDADTGKPLSGVLLSAGQQGTFFSGGKPYIATLTDADGRYRLEGMPIDSDERIYVLPSGNNAYLPAGESIDSRTDEAQITRNFKLKRGVWVRGRAVDDRTGKPVPGRVHYYAFRNNPHLNSYAGFSRSAIAHERRTDEDGRFEIPVLPGPGVITFLALDHTRYRRGLGAETITGPAQDAGGNMKRFRTVPSILLSGNEHVLRQIRPAPGSDPIELTLALTSGVDVVGRLLDPDGQPISGGIMSGSVVHGAWYPIRGETFRVEGYYPDRPRDLFFYHPDRKLGGYYRLEGKPPRQLTVKLQRTGSVRGRLVDEDGGPLPGVVLRGEGVPGENYGDSKLRLATDANGRFLIRGLLPGREYTVLGRGNRLYGRVLTDVTVEAGKTKDAGDVTLKPENQPNQRPAPAPADSKANPAAARSQPQTGTTTVRGRVLERDGKPAAGAHVAAIGRRTRARRGGDLGPSGEVLAQATTDANGQYALSLTGVSSKTHREGRVVARKDGLGIAWQKLNLDATSAQASLALPSEEPIRGRLVDIEGQPAAGVRLSVTSVVRRAEKNERPEGVGFRGEALPAAWLPSVTSDEQGRFTIRGVPRGHGVFLRIEGSDRFAPQGVALGTGLPERRGERDGTYRPLVKNARPGEEVVVALSPAQIFEGVVTYEDTGEPVPHARVNIWASQEEFGSMVSVAGKTDAKGRYRINPKPGIRFGVTAYPPEGAPYLVRTTPLSKAIRWDAGDRIKRVDLSLPRGVLVRGQVVEAGTGAQIPGASVQYIPESANNPHTSDDIVTGWQAVQLSDQDGRFTIAVLPGPGRLLVHGPNDKYVSQEIGSRRLYRGAPGGERKYAHAIEKIEPAPDAASIEVNLELKPGATVSGRVVDEQGEPIDEVLVISRLDISPLSLYWRGHTTPTLGGRFEIGGLEEGREYPVYFLAPQRRLGATAKLTVDGREPTVVLRPCGQATLRFVYGDGQPVAGFYPLVEMVVTPGPHRYSRAAMHFGALAADSDFISNIDRTNYRTFGTMLKTDEQGKVTLPALIPGATYLVLIRRDGQFHIAREFEGRANETLKPDDIVVEKTEQQ